MLRFDSSLRGSSTSSLVLFLSKTSELVLCALACLRPFRLTVLRLVGKDFNPKPHASPKS